MGWLIAAAVVVMLGVLAWRSVRQEVALVNHALQVYARGGWLPTQAAAGSDDTRQLFAIAEDPTEPEHFAILRVVSIHRSPPRTIERSYRLSKVARTAQLLVTSSIDLASGRTSQDLPDDAPPMSIDDDPIARRAFITLWARDTPPPSA